jgi:hypothetical protein
MSDKILVFLDADPNRAAVHYHRLVESDRARTFWVKTVKETIDILIEYRERLEEVSLEYDLGEEPDAHPSREDCGLEVVRWLEKQDLPKYKHVQFVVHSWNIRAATKMVARLMDAGYDVTHSPFGTRK